MSTLSMRHQLALYLVTDLDQCSKKGRSVARTVAEAVQGGVTCVQVRFKGLGDREFLTQVGEIAGVLPAHVPLIINDQVDLFMEARAKGIKVDGVHIGADDGDPLEVRKRIGPNALLGLSVRTHGEISRWNHSEARVNYFGIGPVYDTSTKRDAPRGMGANSLADLVAQSSIACVAIGGINSSNLAELNATGVAGVAVVSAVCAAQSPRDASTELRAILAGFETAQRDAPQTSSLHPSLSQPSSPQPGSPAMPVVLTIAGTDPTAGAGLQGDNKTIGALGCYAVSVVTAVVAQNTCGVRAFECVDPALVRSQLDAVCADTAIDAIKIGMLGSREIITAVTQWVDSLPKQSRPPIIIDPVMVATSGDALFDFQALEALRNLIERCTVVTPNAAELAVLTSSATATTFDQLLDQARTLARTSGVHVTAKGGHLSGALVNDALVSPDGPHCTQHIIAEVQHKRVDTHRTHGTGCALSSAIAAHLAQQPNNLPQAFLEARAWLQRAIEGADALAFGQGNGPINHLASATDEAILAPIRDLSGGRNPNETLPGWWEVSSRIRGETDQLPFVKELAKGTLPTEDFLHYLEQDALYLRAYSRALAVAANLAPTLVEQRFWMQGAHMSLVIERALHDSWLTQYGLDLEAPAPTPVNRDYTEHFLTFARNGEYELLVAALLPCYWMYQDIGDRLNRTHNHREHPYRSWLTAYSEPRFARSTLAARTIVAHHVDKALERGDERLVTRMGAAFLASCRFERDFFAGPATYGQAARSKESLARA